MMKFLDARDLPPDPGLPPRQTRGWRAFTAVFIIYAITIAIGAGVRADPDPADGTSDFRDFWRTAAHFRESGEIRSDLGVHNYPPFFVILMVPWSLLPLRIAAGFFAAMSIGAFALAALMSEINLVGRIPDRPRGVMLIAMGLVLPYATTCALLGNLGLMVLCLIVATWFLVERGRDWEAGLALGLAILIKIIPAALLLFFVLKGRWRTAASALVLTLILGAGLPLAAIGWEHTYTETRGFLERAAGEHSAYATITTDGPRKAKYSNQSLPIVLRRLLSPTNADAGPQGGMLVVNAADLPRQAIFIVYLVIIVGVLAIAGHVTFWRARRWPPDTDEDAASLREQFAVWCGMMLLASPLLWTHYYPVVLWPLACIAHGYFHRENISSQTRALFAMLLIGWLAGAILLAWPAARAVGVHTWLVLATCLVLCWSVWMRRPVEPQIEVT